MKLLHSSLFTALILGTFATIPTTAASSLRGTTAPKKTKTDSTVRQRQLNVCDDFCYDQLTKDLAKCTPIDDLCRIVARNHYDDCLASCIPPGDTKNGRQIMIVSAIDNNNNNNKAPKNNRRQLNDNGTACRDACIAFLTLECHKEDKCTIDPSLYETCMNTCQGGASTGEETESDGTTTTTEEQDDVMVPKKVIDDGTRKLDVCDDWCYNQLTKDLAKCSNMDDLCRIISRDHYEECLDQCVCTNC